MKNRNEAVDFSLFERLSKLRLLPKLICCLMLVSGISLHSPSALAQENSVTAAIYKNLDNLEQTLFSQTYSNELVTQRLDRLEKNVFGTVKTGSLRERLDSLMIATDGRTPASTATSTVTSTTTSTTASTPIAAATTTSTTTTQSPPPLLSSEKPSLAPETKLYGDADLSASLQPLRSSLAAGQKFLTASASEVKSTDVWYRIPAWFAGTWNRSEATYFYPGRAPETRSTIGSMPEGDEIDAEGSVWKRSKIPFNTRTVTASCIEEGTCDRIDILKITADTVIYKDHFILTLVDHEGTIIRSTQLEQIQRYSPNGAQVMSESKVRQFDMNGRATHTYRIDSTYNRVANTPIDRSQEARDSFKAYLVAHGMERLVPAEMKSPAIDY